MKRILALLLAVGMMILAFSLVACGETPVESTPSGSSQSTASSESTASSASTAGSTETTASSETSGTTASTPEESSSTPSSGGQDEPDDLDGLAKHPDYLDVNFGEATFTFATQQGWDGGWDTYEITCELTGDDTILDEAIVNRNQTVEKLYNCHIKEVHGSATKGVVAMIEDDIALGQCNYNFYMALWSLYSAPKNALNIKRLDINLKHSWWDQKYIDCFSSTVDGTEYLTTISGDFNLITMDSIVALFVNKNLYDQLKATGKITEDIFKAVKDGKWTIDMMMKVIDEAHMDVDGDSVMTYYKDDIFGFVCDHNIKIGYGLFYGMGGNCTTKDDTGKQICVNSSNTDLNHFSDIGDKIVEFFKNPGAQYVDGGAGKDEKMIVQSIADGIALFIPEYLFRLHSDNELVNYGVDPTETPLSVVPYPKYDETQEEYYSYVSNRAYGVRISPTNKNLTDVANFLEVFGFHSQKLLYPEYIKYLKTQCLCDKDAGEILDMIIKARTFDFAVFMSPDLVGFPEETVLAGKNKLTIKMVAAQEALYNAKLEEKYFNDLRKTTY